VNPPVVDRVAEYVTRITSMLRVAPDVQRADSIDAADVPGVVFSILTSREFCYLGRTRTEPYREQVERTLAQHVARGEPVRFYYDLGAGYHASIDPHTSGLVFNVGFSELCVLAQVASFCTCVGEVYAPGAVFVLAIDNVCGLVTNDIPLEQSEAYCAELRALIDQTGLGGSVTVLVESEAFAAADYALDRERLERDMAGLSPSPVDIDNVSRFLGRECDAMEAAERMARYRQAGELTEQRLEGVVRGVRMTQRATGGTLGFRPYPGGDSRTQVGELALSPGTKGLRPVLLTSRNAARFRCTRLTFPDLLPGAVRYITYAEPVEPASV
jgi:hypothetical protein